MAEINIHHYQVNQADYQSELISPILSPDEQLRASRFINDVDRIRYVTVHRFLRVELAKVLNLNPIELTFVNSEFGKPFVNLTNSKVHFNLSYRGDCALLAISSEDVGIDIELIRPIDDVDAFCSSYFHPNERAIIDQADSNEQPKTIFTFWAFKEAFIKALGIGFSQDLTEFDLSPFFHSPSHKVNGNNVTTINRIVLPAGYVGAVCYIVS